MDLKSANDSVMRRVRAMGERESMLKENGLYFYNQPVEEVKGGVQSVVRVTVEIEGSDRPACVVDTISRYFPA